MNKESRRKSEIKLLKDYAGSREFIEIVRLKFCEELTKQLLVFEDSVLTVPEQKLVPNDSYEQHLLVHIKLFFILKFNLFRKNRLIRLLYLGKDVIKYDSQFKN